MKWTTTKLITVGGLAVIWILLGLVGGGINVITGVPGAGGIINIFVVGFMCVICGFLIREFGALTLMGFIYGVLAIPLPNVAPPGFLPKVFIGLAMGFVGDIVFLLLKRYNKLDAIIVSIMTSLTGGLSIYGLAVLFSVPGATKFAEMVFTPIGVGVFLVLAILGGYVGWLVYTKIQNTATIRRIQGS